MWNLLYGYCIFLTICLDYVNLIKIEETLVNKWASDFKTELDSHLEKGVSYTKVQDMLRNYESYLNDVPINGKKTFEDIYTNVNLKYNDLVLAVNKLKSELQKSLKANQASDDTDAEKASIYSDEFSNLKSADEQNAEGSVYVESLSDGELDDTADINRNLAAPVSGGPPPLGPGPLGPPVVGGGGGGGPPIPLGPAELLQRCCVPEPSRKYTGRFREDVSMAECYENVDDTLRKISRSNIEKVFKENLVNTPVMWQYFADSTGHYIQYPNSDRMCDQASPNSTSPLLQEWFVEKLYMERKNLVILVDNGPRTSATGAGTPYTDRDLLIDAVKQTLSTLTPNDKVNIVTLQPTIGGSRTAEACVDELFIATPSNLDYLSNFASQLPYGQGEHDLSEAFKKVYKLYQHEKLENQAGYNSRTNLVLMLLSNQSQLPVRDETALYETIATQQQQLDHSVQHFVYVVGQPAEATITGTLAKIADQNNIKLQPIPPTGDLQWPAIPNLVTTGTAVGKEGVLEFVEQRDNFPFTAAKYFNRLPPQLDDRKTTLIVPVFDKTAGLLMSVAATVYGQDPDLPVGVASVDASLGEVFSDIINVDVGEKSYGFIVDVTHGHVLIHPKLHDGSDGRHSNMLFPRLQLLEPDLSPEQIQSILQANETMGSFNASISLGRLLVSGELVRIENKKREPVTVYYQLGYGTSLCVVFVHFLSDEMETSLQKVPLQGHLHAPYHRIDELLPSPAGNKPDKDNVCNLHDSFLSYKESVIKLSPWVFNKPVEYQYSAETFDQISELNSFLINESPTSLLREGQKLLIQHFILSTDDLDSLWKDGNKDVIERFLGSTSGVFRLYPGSPMDNTFDHMRTDWYKRSVAFPDVTMFHYGKLSFTSRNNVIIVSKALVEEGEDHFNVSLLTHPIDGRPATQVKVDVTQLEVVDSFCYLGELNAGGGCESAIIPDVQYSLGRLQGVVGMTITRRLLTSKLIKSVPDCYSSNTQCHILDATGNILDCLLPGYDLHLSRSYPWLTRKLSQSGRLVVDWCTGYSDGYHKETFTLSATLTSDLSSQDECQHYTIKNIAGTNLFILILGNRTQLGCDEQKYEICRSCQAVAPFDPHDLSLPQCQLCLSNLTTECQCECYCDTDLDLCEGQFKVNTPNFPRDACFYPVKQSSRFELQPNSPGPESGLEFCPIPCAAIEDIEICVQLNHCKLDTAVAYPTCIWKGAEELKHSNISRFFPTTAIPEPPTQPPMSTKPIVPIPSSQPEPPFIPQTTSIITVLPNTDKSPLTSTGKPPPATSKPPHTASKPPATTSKPPATTSKPPPTTSKPPHAAPIRPQSTPKPLEISTRKTSGEISSGSPSFVSHVTGSPLLPVTTGTQLHPITGTATVVTSSMVSTVKAPLAQSEPDDGGLSGGAIAAIVLSILLVLAVLAFIAVKLYGKKFRRPGAETSSKYRSRSSLFDSTIFNRATNEVTTGVAPTSTVPYDNLQQP